MAMYSEPVSERDWQARDDARTLARAKEIEADQKRLDAAKVQARVMLEEEKKELSALSKVAGKPIKQASSEMTKPGTASKGVSGRVSDGGASSFGNFKQII